MRPWPWPPFLPRLSPLRDGLLEPFPIHPLMLPSSCPMETNPRLILHHFLLNSLPNSIIKWAGPLNYQSQFRFQITGFESNSRLEGSHRALVCLFLILGGRGSAPCSRPPGCKFVPSCWQITFSKLTFTFSHEPNQCPFCHTHQSCHDHSHTTYCHSNTRDMQCHFQGDKLCRLSGQSNRRSRNILPCQLLAKVGLL